MKQVIAADGKAIAVAGDDPNIEIRIGDFKASRECGRPTVDSVKAVCVYIIRKARGAADARDKYGLIRISLNIRERFLDAFQNGIVTATGAPADFLISGEIFCCEGRVHGRLR